ncbi:hypothetical protein [Luteolibacter marinus]|uniref:hypothetical protein n=1 Tax=Luteolibacter marinus TaxID=2776705 RepID=UPI001868BE54|nr:hypothetical protein [Luteolibacter marinus]
MSGLEQPLQFESVGGVAAVPFLAGYSGEEQNRSEAEMAGEEIPRVAGNRMFSALRPGGPGVVQG